MLKELLSKFKLTGRKARKDLVAAIRSHPNWTGELSTMATRKELDATLAELNAAEPTAATLHDAEPPAASADPILAEERAAALEAGLSHAQAERFAQAAVENLRTETMPNTSTTTNPEHAAAAARFKRQLAMKAEASKAAATPEEFAVGNATLNGKTPDQRKAELTRLAAQADSMNRMGVEAVTRRQKEIAALQAEAVKLSSNMITLIAPTDPKTPTPFALKFSGGMRYPHSKDLVSGWAQTAPEPVSPRFSFAWAIELIDYVFSLPSVVRGKVIRERSEELELAGQILDWAALMRDDPLKNAGGFEPNFFESIDCFGETRRHVRPGKL